MEWKQLLSTKTQTPREIEENKWQDYPISDFEKDYKMIISSAAFRRLQDKTQVFPLDKSDFVRTRLTHSLEVSTIARQLGIMITNNNTGFLKKEFKDNPEYFLNIPSVLSCAGLLHDLGNPPFGHFGEVVIRDWFKKEFRKKSFAYRGKPIKDILTEDMQKDLCNFEGNAQALRILSKKQKNPEGYDANLTYSVLNTLVKYPTASKDINTEDNDVKKHKMGYFTAEKDFIDEICIETGTKQKKGEYVRHPLTYLMEAADDIAYATSDLEDALKKGKFSIRDFIAYYKNQLDTVDESYKKKKSKELIENLESRIEDSKNLNHEEELAAFQNWTEYTKKWLMYVVVFSFNVSNNYEQIMSGEYKKDLFADGFHEHTIKILKKAMSKFAFNSPEILKLELAAQKIISGLLNDFIYAVIHLDDRNDDNYKPDKTQKKLIEIISENYRNDYLLAKGKDESANLYLRFLMVTDYISGMTDSFAKNLYQELNGID